jgi:hypothetical protein
MIIKSTDNQSSIVPLEAMNPETATSGESDGYVFDQIMLDTNSLSALQSIFNSSELVDSKTASIKFMITIQDEADLLSLGYSKKQIDRLKPQDALDIIRAGTKAELPSNLE